MLLKFLAVAEEEIVHKVMENASLVINFSLFVLAFVVLFKKQTICRCGIFICIFASVHIGYDIFSAYLQGTNIFYLYSQITDTALDEMEGKVAANQLDQIKEIYNVFALCSVGIQVLSDAFFVFVITLMARFFTTRKRAEKCLTPLSKIDLKIWSLYPLIGGVVLLAVSFIPQVPQNNVLFAIAVNVLVISALPLFAQGAGACKGIMNNLNLSKGSQVLICGILLIFGVLLLIVPAVGLVDYWANFRKLPREDSAKKDDDSRKKELPKG